MLKILHAISMLISSFCFVNKFVRMLKLSQNVLFIPFAAAFSRQLIEPLMSSLKNSSNSLNFGTKTSKHLKYVVVLVLPQLPRSKC